MPDDNVQYVDEIVMPDIKRLGPTPQGYPVVLGNGKAYYFPCISEPYGDDDPIKPLVDATTEAQKVANAYERDEVDVNAYVKACGSMAMIALALQYSDAALEPVIKEHAVTTKHYLQISATVMGFGPGYDVQVKKK